MVGNLVGTPGMNTAILAFGTMIASLLGTTGAAMLLVRPLIRANEDRRRTSTSSSSSFSLSQTSAVR